ncbi:MAG: transposase [Psychroserpens sp.]|jgi:transposase
MLVENSLIRKKCKADVALNLIVKLYGIEANLKGKSVEEKSVSIIDKLHHWVIDNKDKITRHTL